MSRLSSSGRTMLSLLALAAAAAATRTPSANGTTARLAILKNARTGSTWMADMLKRQPATAFWVHEGFVCLKGRGTDASYRAMRSVLAAPACDMRCGKDDGDTRLGAGEAWRAAPRCLANRLVGFDVNPQHWQDGSPMSWDGQWAPLLRLPEVTTVVYVRSNLAKLYVSKKHVERLVGLCRTHKVRAGEDDCYEAHKAALDEPLNVTAYELAYEAWELGRRWLSILGHARSASGRERFPVVYYEALQADARAEFGRLFAHVGLPRPAKISTRSVKVTADKLKHAVRDFKGVARQFDDIHHDHQVACVKEQFLAAEPRLFPNLCMTPPATLADYDVFEREEYK